MLLNFVGIMNSPEAFKALFHIWSSPLGLAEAILLGISSTCQV
jgi:hypothetical protein